MYYSAFAWQSKRVLKNHGLYVWMSVLLFNVSWLFCWLVFSFPPHQVRAVSEAFQHEDKVYFGHFNNDFIGVIDARELFDRDAYWVENLVLYCEITSEYLKETLNIQKEVCVSDLTKTTKALHKQQKNKYSKKKKPFFPCESIVKENKSQ